MLVVLLVGLCGSARQDRGVDHVLIRYLICDPHRAHCSTGIPDRYNFLWTTFRLMFKFRCAKIVASG